jgi:hypothetical protein
MLLALEEFSGKINLLVLGHIMRWESGGYSPLSTFGKV